MCLRCHSDCVEEIDQNIEEFVGLAGPGITHGGDILVQQVMNRVIGLNSAVGQAVSVQQNQSGRPVSIIVRQIGSAQFPDLSSMNIPAAPSSSQQSAHNIFGLLSSLTSLRESSQTSTRRHNLLFEDTSASEEQANSQWEDFLHYILMNENSHAGAPPAPKGLLEGLKRVPITADTDITCLGECCITQDPFEAGDVMVRLPCGHAYKQEPIVHWLAMHNTCPVCRVEVSMPSSDTR